MNFPKRNPSAATLVSSGKPYRLLVANFSKPHTPEKGSGTDSNPIKTRLGFVFNPQFFLSPGASAHLPVGVGTGSRLSLSGNATRSTGVVTVANNNFGTGRAEVYLGPYVLVAGEEFAVGGDAATTASNLAAAISGLPGFSAVGNGADVEITGPVGSQPVVWKTRVYGTIANFSTITPNTGYLSPGTPAFTGETVF